MDGDTRKTLVEHWNGSDWTIAAAPSPGSESSALLGAASTGGDDVWAVGDVILHWDGKTWSRVPAHFWFTLNDVRGLARDDVWAVGEEGVLHWDGKAWTVVEVEREAVRRAEKQLRLIAFGIPAWRSAGMPAAAPDDAAPATPA